MQVVNLVCAKDGIPEAEHRGEISDIMRMVEVMVRGWGWKRNKSVGTPRKLVPAVAVKGFSSAHNHPEQSWAEVHFLAKNHATQRPRKCSSQNELNRVRIVSRNTDWSYMLMVNLVYKRVNPLPVKESMREVESEVFTEHTKGNLEHESFPIWKFFYWNSVRHLPVLEREWSNH